MRGRWVWLAIVWAVACDTDFFPEGLYHYQVERLLSAGDSAVWEVAPIEGCEEASARYAFTLLMDNTEDSLTVYSLQPTSDCSGYDIIFLGNADASSLEGGLVFTDSLLFSDGTYWILHSLTASQLSLTNDEGLWELSKN